MLFSVWHGVQLRYMCADACVARLDCTCTHRLAWRSGWGSWRSAMRGMFAAYPVRPAVQACVLRCAPPTIRRSAVSTFGPSRRPSKQKQNKTGCALTEQPLKSYLAPLPPLPPPLHTPQDGAQRALQRPKHKKPKALSFVSKDDGTPPLFCFASSGPLALLARVLSLVQQVVL